MDTGKPFATSPVSMVIDIFLFSQLFGFLQTGIGLKAWDLSGNGALPLWPSY